MSLFLRVNGFEDDTALDEVHQLAQSNVGDSTRCSGLEFCEHKVECMRLYLKVVKGAKGLNGVVLGERRA